MIQIFIKPWKVWTQLCKIVGIKIFAWNFFLCETQKYRCVIQNNTDIKSTEKEIQFFCHFVWVLYVEMWITGTQNINRISFFCTNVEIKDIYISLIDEVCTVSNLPIKSVISISMLSLLPSDNSTLASELKYLLYFTGVYAYVTFLLVWFDFPFLVRVSRNDLILGAGRAVSHG